MNPETAAKHLELIRTLMERSVLYRRTLAPVMLLAGSCGTLGALAARTWQFQSGTPFLLFWMSLCTVALAGSLLVIRRQAIRSREPFWSPPTRRIAQAISPGLLAGLGWAVSTAMTGGSAWTLASLWLSFYGCALHAGGAFMLRGIRLFGGLLMVLGITAFLLPKYASQIPAFSDPNFLMGFGFGILHLGYACYLQVTENRELLK